MGTIKPRTTEVPIFEGDTLDRIEELRNRAERAALAAGRGRAQRMDDDDLADAFGAFDAYMDEVGAAAPKFRLAALRKDDYRDLVAEHPPRADVMGEAEDGKEPEVKESFPLDARAGFNVDTIAEPLILACMARWDAEYGPPQPLGPDDVAELADADFTRVFNAAHRLNDDPGPDPKARLSSLLDRTSSETPESPERLD